VILAIAWLVFIILFDFVHSLLKPSFVDWLRTFGAHLMGLAGLLLATGKFK
jgi:threonine/homoserine/homoserine lactone efflux protein